MSEYQSECGCTIHVAQWTAKRKLVSVRYCPLHKAAPELWEALKAIIHIRRWDLLQADGVLDMAQAAIAKAEGREP